MYVCVKKMQFQTPLTLRRVCSSMYGNEKVRFRSKTVQNIPSIRNSKHAYTLNILTHTHTYVCICTHPYASM